jgi:small-conductance mechanosensitive channel
MQRKRTLAVFVLTGLFVVPATAQEPVSLDAPAVFKQVNDTATWYQKVMELDEGSANAQNLLPRDNAREFAKRALQSSFAFGRAQAAVLSNAPDSGADPNNPATATLQQSVNKASARVTRLEDRLQTLDARLAHTSGTQRDALSDERNAITADLALAKQMEAAVKTMASFSAPRSSDRKGLLDEISKLESLNPVNDASVDKEKGPAARATPELFHPETAGIVVLATKALGFYSTRSHIDAVLDETDQRLEDTDKVRGPLRTAIRAIIAESDSISTSEDNSAQAAQWTATTKQIAALSTRFKQLSSVSIPLSESAMAMQSARGSLNEWRRELDSEYNSTIRYLLLHLALLLGGVLLILLASAVWQRAIFRYVTEPRRRRQLLLIKRVVVGLALAVLLTVGFLSSIGSVATLLGFVTAGLALALQNVILSAVAYFFLIGKYGLKVGDRITVQGVTGQVIEVGFIRLFLMELVGTGTELHPTGRLAVFANSVIFQPSALMKQAPGIDYAWHTVTVTVENSADYQQARARLTKAVDVVYEDYRQAIDHQHKAFEQTTDVQTEVPKPVTQTQFNDNGLEITIRYPVSLKERPGHIDERMVDGLVAEAETEPKLRFASGGAPKISQVV